MGDKIEKNEMGGTCSTYGGRGEVYTGFRWENQRERDHLGDPDVDGRIILTWFFRKWDGWAWTGLNWLMIVTGSGHF